MRRRWAWGSWTWISDTKEGFRQIRPWTSGRRRERLESGGSKGVKGPAAHRCDVQQFRLPSRAAVGGERRQRRQQLLCASVDAAGRAVVLPPARSYIKRPSARRVGPVHARRPPARTFLTRARSFYADRCRILELGSPRRNWSGPQSWTLTAERSSSCIFNFARVDG